MKSPRLVAALLGGGTDVQQSPPHVTPGNSRGTNEKPDIAEQKEPATTTTILSLSFSSLKIVKLFGRNAIWSCVS
ncbi:hypothetical protein DMENIID0001_054020 [Sergentomyia squamirostris]